MPAKARATDVTLRVERYGDVLRLRMESAVSRAFGLDVSAYVVRGVLVDTGFHHARHALQAVLGALDLRGVIVTHWHEDHAGNIELLAGRGLPLLLRADTESILRARPPIRPYRRVTWGHPPPLRSSYEPLALQGLEVIHTPGHSADHQVVWDPESRTLFSGDLWLGVRSRVMHEVEDPQRIVASLRDVIALEPARMFDAHRGLIANAVEALQAKADWLSATIIEIERRIASGWSDRAIARTVLGREEVTAYLSGGEYGRRNFVRAVRRAADSR